MSVFGAAMLSPASLFAGEPYLQVKLPNYSQECFMLSIGLLLTVLFWFVLYPLFIAASMKKVLCQHQQDEQHLMQTKKRNERGALQSKEIIACGNETKTEKMANNGIDHVSGKKIIEKDAKQDQTQKLKIDMASNETLKSIKNQPPARDIASSTRKTLGTRTRVVKTTIKTTEQTVRYRTMNGSSSSSTSSTPKHIKSPISAGEMLLWATVVGIAVFFTTVGSMLLYWSPYNYFTPRRVFVFPIFTPQECQAIIDMAETAASKNYEEALDWSMQQQQKQQNNNSTTKEDYLFIDPEIVEASTREESYRTMLRPPLGWHKLRHGNYPTTDLNLITDPFTKENRTFVGNLLDQRLGPTMERIYGIPQQAIRAIDMFVVRYDEGIRTFLKRHTDAGDISFTVLLNNEFEGGGTRFWKRDITSSYKQEDSNSFTLTGGTTFGHVQPSLPGTVVTNHALIEHEGYHVTNGTRFVLVGFTNVDRFDPWTRENERDRVSSTTGPVPTGLGWSFASWFNIAWLNVKFRTGYHNGIEREQRREQLEKLNRYNSVKHAPEWFDHPTLRSIFAVLVNLFEYLGDTLATHQVEYLVSDDNASSFIHALDKAYKEQEQEETRTGRVNWWKGQMVTLDFTGKVESTWNPRVEFRERFEEL